MALVCVKRAQFWKPCCSSASNLGTAPIKRGNSAAAGNMHSATTANVIAICQRLSVRWVLPDRTQWPTCQNKISLSRLSPKQSTGQGQGFHHPVFKLDEGCPESAKDNPVMKAESTNSRGQDSDRWQSSKSLPANTEVPSVRLVPMPEALYHWGTSDTVYPWWWGGGALTAPSWKC